MIISEADATWAADEFINYFGNFTSIEDYLRFAKGEAVSSVGVLEGISDKDKFFNEDLHPEDMECEIKNVGDRFNDEVIHLIFLLNNSSFLKSLLCKRL